MLKLEIKLDDDKIIADSKYKLDGIYQTLEKAFIEADLQEKKEANGTLMVYGTGKPADFGSFGWIITSLKKKEWFMKYVTKWIWYNSDDGYDENDFAVEDVLYHYTKRKSAA